MSNDQIQDLKLVINYCREALTGKWNHCEDQFNFEVIIALIEKVIEENKINNLNNKVK
jgi:hypothetical protein